MKRGFERWEIIFVAVVFLAGLALRLRLALFTYLNPDEAVNALLSFGTWGYALSNWVKETHPPLLMVITHAVSLISRKEIALRLVPVLAGSLFPLLFSVWLRRVSGRVAAMTALFLLTLAPHLIAVSAAPSRIRRPSEGDMGRGFTERETLFVLAYYLGENELPRPATRQFSETVLGGRWRVATTTYNYITRDAYKAGLAAFRRQYGLAESEPVWVLDGGFDVPSMPPDEKHPFTRAVRVFQAP